MSNLFTKFLGANKITLIKDGEKLIIACDCITSENHKFSAEATQYEIEDGSDMSDHVIKRGKTLTIEGIVSDDPVRILQTEFLERTMVSLVPTILKSKLSFGLSGDSGKPSLEAFGQFEQIYDKKIPVTIMTGLKKYENMIMEDFDAPRDSKTVRALKFTATFRQITIVSTILTSSPATTQTVELGAQKKKNIGQQGTGTNLPTTDNRTISAWVVDTGMGFFTGQ